MVRNKIASVEVIEIKSNYASSIEGESINGHNTSSDEIKEKGHRVFHYVNILSGPLLSCICASFMCLVPLYNVIEYPNSWYLEQLSRFTAAIPIWICQVLIETIIWSDLPLERNWVSYIFLFGTGFAGFWLFEITYYFIWTHYLGLFQPMPFNGHICGSLTYGLLVLATWFRYVSPSNTSKYSSLINKFM